MNECPMHRPRPNLLGSRRCMHFGGWWVMETRSHPPDDPDRDTPFYYWFGDDHDTDAHVVRLAWNATRDEAWDEMAERLRTVA